LLGPLRRPLHEAERLGLWGVLRPWTHAALLREHACLLRLFQAPRQGRAHRLVCVDPASGRHQGRRGAIAYDGPAILRSRMTDAASLSLRLWPNSRFVRGYRFGSRAWARNRRHDLQHPAGKREHGWRTAPARPFFHVHEPLSGKRQRRARPRHRPLLDELDWGRLSSVMVWSLGCVGGFATDQTSRTDDGQPVGSAAVRKSSAQPTVWNKAPPSRPGRHSALG
jgi:hypothetical protein